MAGGQSRSLKEAKKGGNDPLVSVDVPVPKTGLSNPVKKGQSVIDAAFPDFDPVAENRKEYEKVQKKPASTYDTIKNRSRNIDATLDRMEKGED